jgi:rhodanese-related sulfurtransferase
MTGKTAAELVATAKAAIENLSPHDVSREQSAGTLIVDIREPEERARTGVIPGSVHAARGMLEFYADPTSTYHREEFDPQRRIILHCASGGRSALATQTLQEMGYQNVAHLDSGMTGWIAEGLPVTSEKI